jgi:exodeoxyribonuclease-3
MDDEITLQFKERDSNLVICGDYNICHEAIDIHNPVQSKKNIWFCQKKENLV